MRLFVVTLLLSVACRGNGVDPSELRMAHNRVRSLEQQLNKLEAQRLRDACQVVDLLLRENAVQRIDLAAKMARVKQLAQLLHVVAQRRAQRRRIKRAHHHTASDIGGRLITNVLGGAAPAFIFILDLKGRVVARIGMDEQRYGDNLAGYFSVGEALQGYMRDDLWILEDRLYRVAVAPVVQRELKEAYVGAIVVGHKMADQLASELAKRLRVNIGFYQPKGSFARSARVAGVDRAITATLAKLGSERRSHCLVEPAVAADGEASYFVLTARLPGEAGMAGAGYAVFARRSARSHRKE